MPHTGLVHITPSSWLQALRVYAPPRPATSAAGGSGPQGGSRSHRRRCCNRTSVGQGQGRGVRRMCPSPGISGRRAVLYPGSWAGGPTRVLLSRRTAHTQETRPTIPEGTTSVYSNFPKIERIKQIRADVPTCNYQLISLDFFFFLKRKFQNSSQISSTAAWARGWLG